MDVERTDQMLDARHSEDEMHAAIARQTKVARLSSGAESPGVQNTINIDRIKFIAVCDQKTAKLVERVQELTVYGAAAVAKAEKIKALGGDKSVEAENILRELSAKHVLAEQYLTGVLKGKIGEIRDKAKAAQTTQHLVDARA